jgi:hypothetical protein
MFWVNRKIGIILVIRSTDLINRNYQFGQEPALPVCGSADVDSSTGVGYQKIICFVKPDFFLS